MMVSKNFLLNKVCIYSSNISFSFCDGVSTTNSLPFLALQMYRAVDLSSRSRRLVLNIFPFPVSTEKLLGDFYNNRRSTAISFPRFTYSFVVLMLRQYYWRCDSYSANKRSAANIKKIRENFVLALRICPASPISAECHAAPINLAVAAIQHHFYQRYIARTASPIDPELTYNFYSTDRKRK